MAEGNSLPQIYRISPKDVVVRGIKNYIASLGPLNAPIDVSKDYPSRESFAHNNRGERINSRRRIVVKKLKNTVALHAIGDSYTGTFITYKPTEANDNLAAIRNAGVGWIDEYTFEISVWTTDADDRDNLIELIKVIMLELTQGRSETNIQPYFLSNGFLSVKFASESDSQDPKVINNGVIYSGNTIWNVMVPFYHTYSINYHGIRSAIIDPIINFPGDGGDTDTGEIIIVDPGDGTTPGSGGGGDGGNGVVNPTNPPKNGSDPLSTKAVLVLPAGLASSYRFKTDNQIVYVGSRSEGNNTSSNLSAYLELLQN